MKQIWKLPYTFVLMNWAAVVSLAHFIRRGKNLRNEIWTVSPMSHSHGPSTAVASMERQGKIAA